MKPSSADPASRRSKRRPAQAKGRPAPPRTEKPGEAEELAALARRETYRAIAHSMAAAEAATAAALEGGDQVREAVAAADEAVRRIVAGGFE